MRLRQVRNRPHPARERGRVLRRAAVVLAGCAAAVLGAVTPAQAGHVHAIQTANSPSDGAPIAGGGSWIVNKPSGYYLGRLMPGDRFDDEVTSSANWHYGRAQGAVNMCGWVMPGSMGAALGDTADSCSSTTESTLSHRRTFGRDYNAAAHQAGDGTAVPANPACELYYNYFYGTDFGSNGGHWATPAGTVGSTVRYRFTTNDGAAVVVRDPVLGWGFLPIGCVQRPATLYNDND
ncbi:hypothetical protein GCM10023322_65530 [Rugosimonospora acidiphila]|uniref:Secreted protein n=1 Tax=Rugosimonospora acidiphila TaxID=556531 RepID=A0ABP9SIL6_9ACTN